MSDIILDGVTRIFAGARDPAVDALTMKIKSGEFVCLLGPSGCGKTTTLRMVAGLEPLDDGEMRYGSQVLACHTTGKYVPPEARGMGLMFQSYALWPHMTVADNIRFGLEMQRWPRNKQERRVHEMLDLLRIEGLGERYPNQLSGGQQQRVALARMLAPDPEVLLLDEPLSNLDARLRLEMRAELKRLHHRLGSTIVYVTHDQLEALTLATRVAVMNEGRLQQFAEPLEVYNQPANRYVAEFVGHPTMNVFDMSTIDDRLRDRLLKPIHTHPTKATSIGVRPEKVHIINNSGTASDSIVLNGTVETILPTGPEWIIGVRIHGQTVFSLVWEPPKVGLGDEVHVELRTKELHMFDVDGNRFELR